MPASLSSAGVGVWALVERDASAAEMVDGTWGERRQECERGHGQRERMGSGRERSVPRGSVDSRSKGKEKETSVHALSDACLLRASAEAHHPLASLGAQRKERSKETCVEK